jgi:hypothetical protein
LAVQVDHSAATVRSQESPRGFYNSQCKWHNLT